MSSSAVQQAVASWSVGHRAPESLALRRSPSQGCCSLSILAFYLDFVVDRRRRRLSAFSGSVSPQSSKRL